MLCCALLCSRRAVWPSARAGAERCRAKHRALDPAHEERVLGAALRRIPDTARRERVRFSAGGFARPDGGFTTPLGIEQGHLSQNARILLGPRAPDVQVRDSFVRPTLSTTTLTPAQPRADVVTYTVQPGDTPWDIALRFNV